MNKKYLVIMGFVIFSFVLMGCGSTGFNSMDKQELNDVCGDRFYQTHTIDGDLHCGMNINDYNYDLWSDFCNQENITTRDCLNYHVYMTKE